MERHQLDPISFVFGLLFVGVALVGLIDGVVIAGPDLRWLLPGITIVLGLVLVISAATSGRSRDEDDGERSLGTAGLDDVPAASWWTEDAAAQDLRAPNGDVDDQSADDRSGGDR